MKNQILALFSRFRKKLNSHENAMGGRVGATQLYIGSQGGLYWEDTLWVTQVTREHTSSKGAWTRSREPGRRQWKFKWSDKLESWTMQDQDGEWGEQTSCVALQFFGRTFPEKIESHVPWTTFLASEMGCQATVSIIFCGMHVFVLIKLHV